MPDNVVHGTNAPELINRLDGVTDDADTIHAGGGQDNIYGYGGNDTIYGQGGNDVIWGGGGADDIYGGSGSDWSNYQFSDEGVVVTLVDGLGFGGEAEGDTLSGIENLVGSNHNDVLIGNDAKNILTGYPGNDSLVGGGGDDTLNGDFHSGDSNPEGGDDTLKGGGGADTIFGGGGIDTASYYDSGAGVFVSLAHDDAAWGDAEGDELDGIENLIGSAHADHLYGDDGINVLKGENGNDTLKGYGGADSVDGGAGSDTMYGGLGDDRFYVDSASDTVTELSGQGHDTVFSSAFSFVLAEQAAFVEVLSLDTATDTGVYATGNSQQNTIFGNGNDNVLDGGGGADGLSGLGGNDTFVFHAGQAHGDVVYEFNGNGAAAGDVLQFRGYGTLAEGATFHQLTATEWRVTSADGTISEIITLASGAVIDTTTDLVFA